MEVDGKASEHWLMASLQKKLGLTIRRLREEKEISQEALAALCDLHRTYVGLVERGRNSISITKLERIAHALGVETSQLLAMAEKAKD